MGVWGVGVWGWEEVCVGVGLGVWVWGGGVWCVGFFFFDFSQ